MIAVVRIAGQVNIPQKIRDTLTHLNLHSKNACTLVKEAPETEGMIRKVESYVTYGTVSKEMEELLRSKMGQDKYVRLQPPLKGYGRKGIKASFSVGGALGNRGEKINDLLKRMLHEKD